MIPGGLDIAANEKLYKKLMPTLEKRLLLMDAALHTVMAVTVSKEINSELIAALINAHNANNRIGQTVSTGSHP